MTINNDMQSRECFLRAIITDYTVYFQETHIMHKFEEDFYGSWLRVVICGYIRPEQNYKSLGREMRDKNRC